MPIKQPTITRRSLHGRRTVTRLRLLRTEAGLTLKELGKLANVSHGGISGIERKNVRNPKDDTLRRLADVLGYKGDPAELLDHVDVCQ